MASTETQEQPGARATREPATHDTQSDDTLGTYDDYAAEYGVYTAQREAAGADPMGILPVMLDLLGNLTGVAALDVGCGDGYLARIMAARGAQVTGVDVSPRLIQMARDKDPHGAIDYRVADLSGPQPELHERFNVAGSYLALNDVANHRGFISNVAAALKPGGRAVLSLNNPYAYVVRKRMTGYFATGTAHPSGLAASGIKVRFYHRTLAEYLEAFLDAGLQFTKIVDVDHPAVAARRAAGQPLAQGDELPRFMVLALGKP